MIKIYLLDRSQQKTAQKLKKMDILKLKKFSPVKSKDRNKNHPSGDFPSTEHPRADTTLEAHAKLKSTIS